MIAIKFENISKQYQLGTIGTGTLSHDLNRWWQMNIRGKEDPYLKVGQSNTLASREKEGYVWALRDINLRVDQGEVLGIIGKNGAGKSTLLKLLSRVTAPTTGRIRAWGRVASLLEVGTGFHPEMTGRENIYMNGSIMGMTNAEINRKFDEIVDFAGVERYIDTPVKRYSSGMTVRLGFAIAAHLEPEILVVDEVLAVGDAEFQKKAIGKMQDISTGLGRTVLFVSHNMASIKNLCKSGVLLSQGKISYVGSIDDVISLYTEENKNLVSKDLEYETVRKGNGIVKFVNFYLTNSDGRMTETVYVGDDVGLNFRVLAMDDCVVNLGFSFFSLEGEMLSSIYSSYQNCDFSINKGESLILCKIKGFPFQIERLLVRGVIYAKNELADWPQSHLGVIDVSKGDFYGSGRIPKDKVPFLFKGEWTLKDIK